MSRRSIEGDWSGRRHLECRLLADEDVIYRGEALTGAVLIRGVSSKNPPHPQAMTVEVRLYSGRGSRWLTPTLRQLYAVSRAGSVPSPPRGEERRVAFNMEIRSHAYAQSGILVAQLRSTRWHRRCLAQAVLPVRIGPERSAEELIVDLASLAEAKAEAWNAPAYRGIIRARLSPLRSGARYRSLSIVAKVSGGRAQGTLQVVPVEGPVKAYQLDLRLADRLEYRQTLWRCLAPHVDLSGQFPIPAGAGVPALEQLPTTAGCPHESAFERFQAPER